MNILLLSTADWEHPFWTNKQHVARTLAENGHKVVYVDSLGLRQITTKTKDRQRVFRRLKGVFLSPRLVRKGLWIISPIVLPGIQKGFFRWLNRFIMSLTLLYAYRRIGFKCNVLWTYSPATTLYLNPSDFEHSIYHCVDDISVQPNMPTKDLRMIEKETARKVNHIVVTTNNLFKRMQGHCSNLHIMPNVVEYKHFANPSDSSLKKASRLMENLPRPIIGFVGAISNYKVNFDLLLSAVDEHIDYSFVLIGSVGEGESSTNVSELYLRKNIFFLGPQPYKDLPGFMKQFDVGILPSQRNDYTISMFPMKFFEYLATGIPVVAMEIPALLEYRSLVTLCKDAKTFSDGIANAVNSQNNHYDKEKRQALARENTYSNRTKRMLKLLKN